MERQSNKVESCFQVEVVLPLLSRCLYAKTTPATKRGMGSKECRLQLRKRLVFWSLLWDQGHNSKLTKSRRLNLVPTKYDQIY